MDIQFCDICGESVPAGDLDGGAAKRYGDRLVCKQCDEAMTRHVAPAAAAITLPGDGATQRALAPARNEGSGALWLAAACVAVVALVGFLAVDRVQDAERRVNADAAGRMARLEDRIAGLEHVLRHSVAPIFEDDPNAPRFDAVDDRLARIEARLDDRLDPDLLFAEFEQVSAELRAVSSAVGGEVAADARAEAARLDAIADDVAGLPEGIRR